MKDILKLRVLKKVLRRANKCFKNAIKQICKKKEQKKEQKRPKKAQQVPKRGDFIVLVLLSKQDDCGILFLRSMYLFLTAFQRLHLFVSHS